MHRYHYCFGADADYIVLETLEPAYTSNGWHWAEVSRWMIPGTWIEDV